MSEAVTHTKSPEFHATEERVHSEFFDWYYANHLKQRSYWVTLSDKGECLIHMKQGGKSTYRYFYISELVSLEYFPQRRWRGAISDLLKNMREEFSGKRHGSFADWLKELDMAATRWGYPYKLSDDAVSWQGYYDDGYDAEGALSEDSSYD